MTSHCSSAITEKELNALSSKELLNKALNKDSVKTLKAMLRPDSFLKDVFQQGMANNYREITESESLAAAKLMFAPVKSNEQTDSFSNTYQKSRWLLRHIFNK